MDRRGIGNVAFSRLDRGKFSHQLLPFFLLDFRLLKTAESGSRSGCELRADLCHGLGYGLCRFVFHGVVPFFGSQCQSAKRRSDVTHGNVRAPLRFSPSRIPSPLPLAKVRKICREKKRITLHFLCDAILRRTSEHHHSPCEPCRRVCASVASEVHRPPEAS